MKERHSDIPPLRFPALHLRARWGISDRRAAAPRSLSRNGRP